MLPCWSGPGQVLPGVTARSRAGGAHAQLPPFLDGPGGVPAGLGAEAARGAQGGGEGVPEPEGEPGPRTEPPSVPSPADGGAPVSLGCWRGPVPAMGHDQPFPCRMPPLGSRGDFCPHARRDAVVPPVPSAGPSTLWGQEK